MSTLQTEYAKHSVLKMFQLTDQVAIITGSHSWLGFDMACALAEAGAHIVITSRNIARAEETAQIIQGTFHVDTLAIQMDQTRFEDIQKMAQDAFSWKERIDILINNAGGGSGKSEGHLDKRAVDDEVYLLTNNLIGVLHCCKEVSRYMVQRGYGKIINIASVAGIIGRDRRMYERSQLKGQPIDYAASKAGIIGMTRDLASLLSPKGIYVNAISPGGFEKPGELPERFVNDYKDRTMLGRWGRMGIDIKGPALFLASSVSDYITGQNAVVDGGFSAWQ
jgi:NAD(P)-dependent dehydrogenase (short-subunit alcohol dehydrogenase family)